MKGLSQVEIPPKPLRLALFGLGRAGSIHLANIVANPQLDLKYIVEADKTKWDTFRAKWGLEKVQFIEPQDAKAIFESSDVDATLIATPTFTHEDLVLQSLMGSKAVFCEKPISENQEGTQRCYETAQKVGKPLFCAFNRRFDPSFKEVYDRTRTGEVGHVQLIKTTSRDSPLPTLEYLKTSGGIFHDCAVHDIDLVTWILGEYPIEVHSIANAMMPEIRSINDFDNVVITMKFASGTLAVIDLCRFASYGYDQRLEVFGPKGMLSVQNDHPTQSFFSGNSGVSRSPIYHSFPSRFLDGYQLELEQFIKVAQGSQENPVSSQMTLAVSKIATACEESAKSGNPIPLKWN